MAYKNFVLYFTLIDQIVSKIITNYFTQPFMSVFLIQLCTSLISPVKLSKAPFSQHLEHCDFVSINFLKMLKKNCLYIGSEKE